MYQNIPDEGIRIFKRKESILWRNRYHEFYGDYTQNDLLY